MVSVAGIGKAEAPNKLPLLRTQIVGLLAPRPLDISIDGSDQVVHIHAHCRGYLLQLVDCQDRLLTSGRFPVDDICNIGVADPGPLRELAYG